MLQIVFDDECVYEILLYEEMIPREEVNKIEDLEGRECLYYDIFIPR